MGKGKFILATLASAISGTVIGLLFAPEKGSETRKKINQKSDQYLQELKNEIEEIQRDINTKTKATKDDLDGYKKEASRKGKEILKNAKKMTSYDEWTKKELYDRAKKLEIENYSTMNKGELITALRNR